MVPSSRARGWWQGALLATWPLWTCLFPSTAAGAAFELQLRGSDGAAVSGAVLSAFPRDAPAPPPPADAVMDQRERKFVPHILAVQTGARVRFENGDSVSHHVYSFSPARRFELYLGKGKPGKAAAPGEAVVFDRPGVVALGCNVHDWMLGYVLVLDTPFFTQTDDAGRAALSGLPAGRYRLEVWHPRITDGPELLTRETTVAGGGADRWDLRLAAPLLPARNQEPGFADY